MRQVTIVVTAIVVLFLILAHLVALIHNPLLLQEIDYLMVHTHSSFCSTNVQSYSDSVPSFRDKVTWEILSIALRLKGSNICQVSETFRDFRCTLRWDSIDLDSIHRWNKAILRNVTIRSDYSCQFGNPTETNRPNISDLITLQIFRSIGECVSVSLSPIARTDEIHSPALYMNTLSLNWHSLLRPKIDLTVSKIQIFASIGTDHVQISHHFQIPSPILRIGNWTIQEILEFLPPPPQERGLFPRLGVVNITDMTIILQDMLSEHCHNCEGKSFRYELPNDFFHPLLVETLDASKEGIDPMDIESLVKKVAFTASKNQVIHSITASDFVQNIRDIVTRLRGAMGDIQSFDNNPFMKLHPHDSNNLEEIFNEMKKNWKEVKHAFTAFDDSFREYLSKFERKAEKALKEVKPLF